MAITSALRSAAPLIRRQLLARGFRTTTANHAASPFTMPAMSPTMTEGNISAWKVKEGDKFSAGDVLLEIETDKAQMDVEAQDDGVMAKIIVEQGAKNVPVGTRIAVLAEQDDDLSTLEIPAEDKATPAPTEPSSPKQLGTSTTPPQQQETKRTQQIPSAGGRGNAGFTPSPGVAQLLAANGITDASQITGTGPRGRLLKGDVLAHLGKINASAPSALQERITKLGKLDLSNIKVAQPIPKLQEKEQKAAAAAKPPPKPQPTELELPVDISEVLRVQANLHKTVGAAPPLSEFVSRAVRQANASLPQVETAEDLFNDLVGAPRQKQVGSYRPVLERKREQEKEEVDICDVLTGAAGAREAGVKAWRGGVDVRGGNVLRVTVGAEEGEKGVERGRVFLGTVKGLLERQPERLAL